MDNSYPAYRKLFTENPKIFFKKIVAAQKLARNGCRLCPRQCGVDRAANQSGYCGSGSELIIASAMPHFGEEPPLSGRQGSGTIFFSGCNLKCVFCQNYDISHHLRGRRSNPEKLARLMLSLQKKGCHNINLVTPSHLVHQILAALKQAVENGLKIPLVYNSGGYDSVETLKILEGIVDIYMPDFKFWSSTNAKKYLDSPDYREVTCRALKEMDRQVGQLSLNKENIARSGLLVRHLVMPGLIEETRKILDWIAAELSENTSLNIMNQYHPAHIATRFPEINRPTSNSHYQTAITHAQKLNLNLLS